MWLDERCLSKAIVVGQLAAATRRRVRERRPIPLHRLLPSAPPKRDRGRHTRQGSARVRPVQRSLPERPPHAAAAGHLDYASLVEGPLAEQAGADSAALELGEAVCRALPAWSISGL